MFNKQKFEDSLNGISDLNKDRLNNYINESLFFKKVFLEDLKSEKMKIYEIGSGIGLLAHIFAAMGHKVIATEPASAGFGIMNIFNEIISQNFIANSKSNNLYNQTPIFYTKTSQDLFSILQENKNTFDFACCANVVEHVPDLEIFLDSIVPLLAENGSFRFICPNYAFPYEPHFGIPTLFSKKLTFKFFNSRIISSYFDDPLAFYSDLSWPNVWKLRKIILKSGYSFHFSKKAAFMYLDRFETDSHFVERKPLLGKVYFLLKPLIRLAIRITPVELIPIIDCRITKNTKSRESRSQLKL